MVSVRVLLVFIVTQVTILSRVEKKKIIKIYGVKKSRILQAVENYKIIYVSKSQVCTVVRTRVICQNVKHKFREHSMETPCCSPCEGAPTWPPEINENFWHLLLL